MQGTARQTFPVSVIAIILFQVAALFARSLLDLSLRARGMNPAVANDLSYLIVPPILLVLMFPYLRMCKNSLRELFTPTRLTLRVVALSIVLGLVLRLTYWASLTLLIGTGLIKNDDPDAITGPIFGFECVSLPVFVLSLAVMTAVVPVVEEVMHRGFILYKLMSRGTVPAIVLSAFYFAIVHESGTYIPAFFAGIVLAVQALNYRALWGPIIAHATYNAAATIDWDCFQIVWNPPIGDPTLLKLTWTSIPVIIAGSAITAFIVSRKNAGACATTRQS